MKKLGKIYKYLFLAWPAVLYFSYFPIIALGGNETMNFELSLPLIFLVIFDIVAGILIIAENKLKYIWEYKWWLLYPIFVLLSVAWSLNATRGILTAAILWLIYIAGFSMVVFRKTILKDTWPTLKKVIYGSGIIAVVWCIIQCILDTVGVPREASLLCAGCTKEMFGFSHPSGFAIEPQFMGNLLLIPAVISCYDFLKNRRNLLLIVFAFGIFLTFSRGAIYAFSLALVITMVVRVIKDKNAASLVLIPVVLFSFLLSLNAQGMMSAFSGMGETYNSGVAKVINHLSLGVIDIRTKTEEPAEEQQPVEDKKEPAFDGYVAESTETRVRLTNSAIQIWKKDAKNILIGVGAGGAGQALFNENLSPAPKEIVQNEYASALLETGIIGALLFVFVIVLAVMAALKTAGAEIILVLMAAFAVTLFFFSGFPNALHIYLLPVMLGVCLKEKRLH